MVDLEKICDIGADLLRRGHLDDRVGRNGSVSVFRRRRKSKDDVERSRLVLWFVMDAMEGREAVVRRTGS